MVAPPAAETRRSAPFALAWIDAATLTVLVAIGAAARATGFTSKDLWFDDAWAALPARASLSQALKMVVTAPGYSLAQRSWIRLDMGSSPWAQTPAFVFGLAGIVAMYFLVRSFNWSRRRATLAAAVIAAGPITVLYSTRVKEYSCDFLLACLLLWLAERTRRAPRRATVAALAAASIAAVFISASTAILVAAAWAALLIVAVRNRRARAAIIGGAAVVFVSFAVIFVVFYQRVPSVLNTNWTRRGYLLDVSSSHEFRRTAVSILSGLINGVTGLPVHPYDYSTPNKIYLDIVAICAFAILTFGLGALGRRTVRATGSIDELTIPAVAIAFALIAVIAGRVPLGDGRTDEYLFPSLLLVGIEGVAWAVRRLFASRPIPQPSRGLSWGLAGLCTAVVGAVAWTNLAVYPTIDLRGLQAKIAPVELPSAGVVVEGFNSFAWGLYHLSPTRIAFNSPGTFPWPQGFRVASTSRNFFISDNYLAPSRQILNLKYEFHRIIYIGFTFGTYDPRNTAIANVPYVTYTYKALVADGWHPRYLPVTSLHCFAVVMVRS